jgi:hypothetical protein
MRSAARSPVHRVELDTDETNMPVPHDGMPWVRTLRVSVQGQPKPTPALLLSEATGS